MRTLALILLALWMAALPALAKKPAYLDLARRGWSYQLRTTMVGRDLSIPVHINGRDLAGAALCVVGEAPHPHTIRLLNAFRELMSHVHGKPMPMRFAGASGRLCGSGRTVVLRLYSGYPPNRALTDDLEWANETYGLGLPTGREYMASSPAMAQTFFGRTGQVTHIMVKQPGPFRMGALERTFYTSILVEELFQSFTFGMDVLKFDRAAQFLSKLEESPVNMPHISWDSQAFMRTLVRSNPAGLCAFDVFMLHAVARAPVDQTNDPEFITFIDQQFDALSAVAESTFHDARFAPLLDPTCSAR